MPVIDNMMLAAPGQPGESLFVLVSLGEPRPRARGAKAGGRAAREVQPRDARRQLRRHAFRRPAQALELARALMTQPVPASRRADGGVNPTLGRRLLEHMERCATRTASFLFVEHDMEVVMSHSDRVIVMAEGGVIAEGEPHEVRSTSGDRRLPRLRGVPRPRRQMAMTDPVLKVDGAGRRLHRGRHPQRGSKSTSTRTRSSRSSGRTARASPPDEVDLRPRAAAEGSIKLHGEQIIGEMPHAVTRLRA